MRWLDGNCSRAFNNARLLKHVQVRPPVWLSFFKTRKSSFSTTAPFTYKSNILSVFKTILHIRLFSTTTIFLMNTKISSLKIDLIKIICLCCKLESQWKWWRKWIRFTFGFIPLVVVLCLSFFYSWMNQSWRCVVTWIAEAGGLALKYQMGQTFSIFLHYARSCKFRKKATPRSGIRTDVLTQSLQMTLVPTSLPTCLSFNV